MILLIDNYDSFTFNLVHFLGDVGGRCEVRRNDALTVQQALAMAPEAIVLSPGPCTTRKSYQHSALEFCIRKITLVQ